MTTASEQAETFLSEPQVGVLATVDGRGRPHAMPIWYLYENDEIIISAGRGSQKHRNLERNPWATLVVDRRETPYYALMVRGKAEVGPPLDFEGELRMASRYLGDEAGRRYVESIQGRDGISIRFTPESWLEFHGEAESDV